MPATTYSPEVETPSTIGADAFHGGVRNGILWFHVAIMASMLMKSGWPFFNDQPEYIKYEVDAKNLLQLILHTNGKIKSIGKLVVVS